MGRQIEKQELEATGKRADQLLHPGCLPIRLHQPSEKQRAFSTTGSEIYLDRNHVTVTHSLADASPTTVVQIAQFEGVMVCVLPGQNPGEVSASLILKHSDNDLSIELASTDTPDDLASLWGEWSRALSLPMLVGDLDGSVKPIDAFRATPTATPAPRRKLRNLTGRRPRFLNRRQVGQLYLARQNYGHEREIVART